MRRILLPLIILLGFSLAAQRVRTTRRSLHRPPVEAADSSAVSLRVVVPADSDVVLAGFDKPLSSMFETLFATNRLGSDISCIYLKLDYFDVSGRQLHSCSRRVNAVIPAGATRQLRFPSWDRQGSFYYHRSRKPRVLAAPFSVVCKVDSVELTRD